VAAVTIEERVHALDSLRLTARQTRFVVTVALHGGYCVRRQYQTFASVSHGNAVQAFLEGLVIRRLATRFRYRADRGHLYHLRASSIYRALGQDDNRNRRAASPALIARKLMLLDYVLSEPTVEWLATEQDKIALFRERFGVALSELPQRVYTTRADRRGGSTTRYFLEKQPLGLAADGETVQFVHLVTDRQGRTFTQFLQDYRRLFQCLPAWTVIVVCPQHLDGLTACQAAFQQFVAGQPSLPSADLADVRWYFEARQRVENNAVGQLSMADITRFREMRERFGARDVEDLYTRWLAQGEAALTERDLVPPPDPASRARLVTARLPYRYDQFGSLAGVC
jgi:hypothetical protein